VAATAAFWNGFAIDIDGLDQKDGELSDANENAADGGAGAARSLRLPLESWSTVRNDVPNGPHYGEET